MKILLVEDESLIRMDMAWTLEKEGFEVWEAGDGGQTLAILEDVGTFDLVVTDVDMPGPVNGLTLAFRICDHLPNCRILILSGGREPTANEMPEGSLLLSKLVSPTSLKMAVGA